MEGKGSGFTLVYLGGEGFTVLLHSCPGLLVATSIPLSANPQSLMEEHSFCAIYLRVQRTLRSSRTLQPSGASEANCLAKTPQPSQAFLRQTARGTKSCRANGASIALSLVFRGV